MPVLLIGGGGYIGTVLAETLLDAGREVTVFDRFYFGQEPLEALSARPGFRAIRGDSRTIDKSVFDGVSEVIQLAALSNDPTCDLDPILTDDINRTGTLRCARLAKESGVGRFVFSSSCSVYGESVGDSSTEDSPKQPVSLYAKLKLDAEAALNEMAGDRFCVTSLRNATVYGLSRGCGSTSRSTS